MPIKLNVSDAEEPLYKIPRLLSKILKPIRSTFPGQVLNSDEMTERLRQLHIKYLRQKRYAFSLDVFPIYTSVPSLLTVNLLTYSILTSNIQWLSFTAADIHQILWIIVDNTYFTFKAHVYKQTIGLLMGSSHSAILAITYMNHMEYRSLNICRSCAFFIIYVDDIFILTSSRKEADNIFTTITMNINWI